MKLSILNLALLASASIVLAACSKDKPVTAAQCIASNAQTGCASQVVSQAVGAGIITPGQAALANGQLGLPPATAAYPIATALPTTGTTTVATNTTAPAVLPVTGATITKIAARVQQQMAEASANPNSSYYVDPNAQDVPARPADYSEKAPAAVPVAARAPSSIPQQATADPNAVQ